MQIDFFPGMYAQKFEVTGRNTLGSIFNPVDIAGNTM